MFIKYYLVTNHTTLIISLKKRDSVKKPGNDNFVMLIRNEKNRSIFKQGIYCWP